MPTIHEEYLIPFLAVLKCDCGGDMISTGTALLSDPELYEHECLKCKAKASYKEKYPLIKYKFTHGEDCSILDEKG